MLLPSSCVMVAISRVLVISMLLSSCAVSGFVFLFGEDEVVELFCCSALIAGESFKDVVRELRRFLGVVSLLAHQLVSDDEEIVVGFGLDGFHSIFLSAGACDLLCRITSPEGLSLCNFDFDEFARDVPVPPFRFGFCEALMGSEPA